MKPVNKYTFKGVWAALGLILLAGLLETKIAEGQGTLSNQVLQLLSRTNSWIGTNTFYDLHVPLAAIPSITTTRIYADLSGNLYYQDTLLAAAGGGTTPHNLLSTTHPDTLAGSPTRGAVVVGNATPRWAAVTPSTGFVQYNGTDTVFSTSLANGTAVPAAQITGTLPAISGVNLTNLNASNLASGTVGLARISGLTNAQVDAAAGIVYSKLDLTGSLLNADVNASAAIAYSKLDLSNSLVAGDLTAGSVTMAKINQASATSGQVIAWSGTAWAPTSIAAGGSVTSAALSVPAIFSVAGSPITTTGTFAVSLATQTTNLVWASPNGSTGAPTFRTLVNADFPTSGVAAGTYPSVTVNTRGIVTAASATINLATAGGATLLPAANGGTGIATVSASTALVANGSAWVSTALPACTRFWSFDTGTRLFSCAATAAYGTLTASAPLAVTQTWNNAVVNFTGVDLNVTDTASLTVSSLMTLRVASTALFSVQKDGGLIQAGVAFASLGTATNGKVIWCTNCAPASTPCTGASTGAWAFASGAATWKCPF